jgi:hypothetical protein
MDSMMLFWIVAPYSFVGRCERFGETLSLSSGLQHTVEIELQNYTAPKLKTSLSSSAMYIIVICL